VGYWEQRGCGNVPGSEARSVGLAQQVDDLRSVLQWLYSETHLRILILGISIGSTIAMQAAEHEADRARAVVAISPDAHRRQRCREFLAALVRTYGIVGALSALRNMTVVLRRLLPEIASLNLFARPPRVTVPIHYVFGEQDVLTRSRNARPNTEQEERRPYEQERRRFGHGLRSGNQLVCPRREADAGRDGWRQRLVEIELVGYPEQVDESTLNLELESPVERAVLEGAEVHVRRIAEREHASGRREPGPEARLIRGRAGVRPEQVFPIVDPRRERPDGIDDGHPRRDHQHVVPFAIGGEEPACVELPAKDISRAEGKRSKSLQGNPIGVRTRRRGRQ
jgi:hypothetical protein